MNYQVHLTDKAQRDVDSVLQWFDDQAAHAAGTRWFAQLMAQVATLESHPERCPLAAEAADLGLEIRELLFGRKRVRYRLLFQIEGRRVLILRVWHGARDSLSQEDL